MLRMDLFTPKPNRKIELLTPLRTLAAMFFFWLLTGCASHMPTTSEREIAFAKGVVSYDEGDYAAAYAAWQPLADDDDLAAQRNLGHMNRKGLGVPVDYKEARKYYRAAAEAGLTNAQVNLAMMFLKGEGGAAKPRRAAKWFERAAKAGHPIAQFELAKMYETGEGRRRDMGKSLVMYRAAADQGHAPAQERLHAIGDLFGRPKSPATDPEAHPGIANNAAGPDRPLPLSRLYHLPGSHLWSLQAGLNAYQKKAYKSAVMHWTRLAQQGVAEAQYRLGFLYADGRGVPKDKNEAFRWWRSASQNSHPLAVQAMVNLFDHLSPNERDNIENLPAEWAERF
jgi:hypothetical protein